MQEVLGVTPHDVKDTIIEMCYSMIEKGMAKKSKKYKGRKGEAEETPAEEGAEDKKEANGDIKDAANGEVKAASEEATEEKKDEEKEEEKKEEEKTEEPAAAPAEEKKEEETKEATEVGGGVIFCFVIYLIVAEISLRNCGNFFRWIFWNEKICILIQNYNSALV